MTSGAESVTTSASGAKWCSSDIETYSTTDLKKCGAHVYFENPITDVWVHCFAFDDEPVETWFPGEPIPPRWKAHAESGGKFRGWNSGGFERIAFKKLLGPRHRWPVPANRQWYDTAAQAAAQSLPRALDNAARSLRLPHQKDQAGHRLMLQMCRPRRIEPDGRIIWWNEPEKIKRLAAYCRVDVETERAGAKRLRPLSPMERLVFLWDQIVNDRGVLLDHPFIEAAGIVVQTAMHGLDRRMRELTGGAVQKCSGVQALGRWLKEQGIELPTVATNEIEDDDDPEANGQRDSLDKAALLKLLSRVDLPDTARQAILTRQEAGKSSVAKLTAMRAASSSDGRARGLFLYHGASTGRAAGTKIQLQNLAKPTVSRPERFIPDIRANKFERIEILAPPLAVISSLLRGCLVPAPGHRFLIGDFTSIEARVVAWLAGQNDLVHLFQTGGDPYCAMASKIYRRPITKADERERQIGKALVLGAGFQMGGPKFKVTAAKPPYLVEVSDDEAAEYIATYREANGRITGLWREAEDAAFEAVERPGIITSCGAGKLRFCVRGQFLWMVLPSGRTLAYADPFIGPVRKPWGDVADGVRFFSVPTPDSRRRLTEEDARLPGTISGKWHVTDVFGGKWVENAVQAVARDLLVLAALRLEKRGYPITIHVHDELVSEKPIGAGSLSEMLEVMCSPLPEWATGLPVFAEGFETETRYRK